MKKIKNKRLAGSIWKLSTKSKPQKEVLREV